jgi:hypothetical protein
VLLGIILFSSVLINFFRVLIFIYSEITYCVYFLIMACFNFSRKHGYINCRRNHIC